MNKALALAVLAFAAQATDPTPDTATTVTATVDDKEVKFEAKNLDTRLERVFLTADRTKVKEDWQGELREAIWPAKQEDRGKGSGWNVDFTTRVSDTNNNDVQKFIQPVEAELRNYDSSDWMKCQGTFEDLVDKENRNACAVLRQEIGKILADEGVTKLPSNMERWKDNKAAFEAVRNESRDVAGEAKKLTDELKACTGKDGTAFTDYAGKTVTKEACKAAYDNLDHSEITRQSNAYNRLNVHAPDARKWTNFFWIAWGPVTYWNHFMARWGSVTTLTTFVCDLFMWTLGLPITLERIFSNWGRWGSSTSGMDVNDGIKTFFRSVGYACYGIYPAVFFGFLYLCLTKKIFVKHTGKAMNNETIRKMLGHVKNHRIQTLLNDWEEKTDTEKAVTHIQDKAEIAKQGNKIEKLEDKLDDLKEELENKDEQLDDNNNTILIVGGLVVAVLAIAVGVVLCKKKSNDDTEA